MGNFYFSQKCSYWAVSCDWDSVAQAQGIMQTGKVENFGRPDRLKDEGVT